MGGGVGTTPASSPAAFLSTKLLATFLLASSSASVSTRAATTVAATPLSASGRSYSFASSGNQALPDRIASSRDSICPISPLRLLPQRQVVSMASGEAAPSVPQVQKSDSEWRTILSPEQFRILRQKGTERAGTGKYDKFSQDGIYECAACKTPLYKSTTKFNSGCGWPAFYEGLPGAITETADADGRRIEITCTACGGHLGHTFKGEGFKTPTDERHCVNSISLKFTPANK